MPCCKIFSLGENRALVIYAPCEENNNQLEIYITKTKPISNRHKIIQNCVKVPSASFEEFVRILKTHELENHQFFELSVNISNGAINKLAAENPHPEQSGMWVSEIYEYRHYPSTLNQLTITPLLADIKERVIKLSSNEVNQLIINEEEI